LNNIKERTTNPEKGIRRNQNEPEPEMNNKHCSREK
jgi:hypothetical protein